MTKHAETALLLIDAQMAFIEREQAGERRNNPDAVANMARLLDGFRQAGLPVLHIRHASTEEASPLRPERPGYQPIPEAQERPGEPVVVKHVNSAFIGTDLEARLRAQRVETVLIAGITTNHCVETTTRMAGNLGFKAHLVEDACYTFDRIGHHGGVETAEAIQAMTLSNLAGEFAAIMTTAAALDAILEPETV